MDLELTGKRALVTGSSSGIGEAIARMLAEEGAKVVVHGRNRDRTEAVAREIGGVGVVGELGNDEGADNVAQGALKAYGGIDILVNNAGGAVESSSKQWTEVDETGWIETLQNNTIAVARMIRRLLPAMKERGWGRLIQVASVSGTQPIALGPDYGAAKAGVINMTVSLSRSLGACGVTANSVSPGVIMTPSVKDWIAALSNQPGFEGLDANAIEQKLTRDMIGIPMERVGRPEEIALAVCMIASPKMSYMTGANVRVDGGQTFAVN